MGHRRIGMKLETTQHLISAKDGTKSGLRRDWTFIEIGGAATVDAGIGNRVR
jgi:hypothetical protein